MISVYFNRIGGAFIPSTKYAILECRGVSLPPPGINTGVLNVGTANSIEE